MTPRNNANAMEAARTGLRSSRLLYAVLIAALGFCLSLSLTSVGHAATIEDERPLLFSFDGADTDAGAFERPDSIAIDEASGSVYVVGLAGSSGKGPGPHDSERVVDKFDAAGEAVDFAALGASSLDGADTPGGAFGVEGFFGEGAFNADVAVDNSAAHPGRIYVAEAGGPIHAFDPDGAYLWTLPGAAARACGIDVDASGRLLVVHQGEPSDELRVFAATGSPPAQLEAIVLPHPIGAGYCNPTVTPIPSTLYFAKGASPASPARGLTEVWKSGSFSSLLSARSTSEIAVDRTSVAGHTFAAPLVGGGGDFEEFDAAAALLGGFGGQVLGESRGIAYDPALDRVYVADVESGTVRVFGAPVSGAAPDAASGETDEVTRTSAEAHATVNPQGLANSYRFEWARGGNEVQRLKIRAVAGEFMIDDGTCCEGLPEATPGCCPDFTPPLPFDVSPAALQSALEGLDTIGPGNVAVSGTPASGLDEEELGEYEIEYVGALEGTDVALLRPHGEGLEAPHNTPEASINTLAGGPHWARAESSPPQSLPEDSADHEVSLALTGLDQNAPYSVRVAATNSENKLTAYAVPDAFHTLAPPPAAVEECAVSAVATDSAHIACTVEPQEDATTWSIALAARAEASQAKCEALQAFAFKAVKSGSFGVEPGSFPIAADASGLDPAQSYCVRATATNSGGGDSEDTLFKTLAVPPGEASAAFAAPRTETTARLNARVNPNGEADFEYRFEWKEQGAAEWTKSPLRESTIHAREPILVAEELSGLKPATTYSYRLALAENEAGPAASLGEERTFTTRSLAEAQAASPPSCPNEEVRLARRFTHLGSCRGIELVNNPDKGNQNAFALGAPTSASPVSAGGEKLLWSVAAGAPGAPNGTENSFIARRTAQGWVSQSAAPPAAVQLGGGERAYALVAASPDFGSLLFSARLATGLSVPAPNAFVRLREGVQDALVQNEAKLPNPTFETSVEISDDGDHVFALNPQSAQLEDIGASRIGPPAVPGEVLSLMPGGAPSACGLNVGAGQSFLGSSGGEIGHPGDRWSAREDGSRVYFKAPPTATAAPPTVSTCATARRPRPT